MKILVTGASGFVGSELCATLRACGHSVRGAIRTRLTSLSLADETTLVADMGRHASWNDALRDVDAVVHLAARAHVLNDPVSNRERYFSVNAEGTRVLAESMLQAGVRRLLFVSTIKVNGEYTQEEPFRATDVPRPIDAYGESKWLAEQYLHELESEGLEPIIVRPPLVFGPGVRANFFRLMSWVAKGVPLPFGSIVNARSMVSVWNLCDFIRHLLESPALRHRTYLLSDGEDLSTPQLVRALADAMNRRARLLPVPPAMLLLMGGLAGRRAEVERLCQSLRVESAETRRVTGWEPPVPAREGLCRTVSWFQATTRSV